MGVITTNGHNIQITRLVIKKILIKKFLDLNVAHSVQLKKITITIVPSFIKAQIIVNIYEIFSM